MLSGQVFYKKNMCLIRRIKKYNNMRNKTYFGNHIRFELENIIHTVPSMNMRHNLTELSKLEYH